MSRGIRSFLFKVALLSAPGLALVTAYVATDPFAVLRRPDDYYPLGAVFPRNRDFVSTEMLLRHGDRKYDSFIFGSSRSIPFLTRDWIKHLACCPRPFHFDASLESLYGVWSKVQYLDRAGYALRNALVVADADLLSRPSDDDPRALFQKHPTISGGSWSTFHSAFLEAFLEQGFFVAYFDYRLNHTWRSYMNGLLQQPQSGSLQDWDTNDGSVEQREEAIARTGEEYFRAHVGEIPAPLAGVEMDPAIDIRSRERLAQLATIFGRHGAIVRIVISPLSDRRPINRRDIAVLGEIFGREAVWDFSGDNAITRDPHNYYDASHYRSPIARRLMAQIYGEGSNPSVTGSLGWPAHPVETKAPPVDQN